MRGVPKKKCNTLEDEVTFLYSHIEKQEREFSNMNGEFDEADSETIMKDVLREYAQYEPSLVLSRAYEIHDNELRHQRELLRISHDTQSEIEDFLHTYGIKNTLSILKEFESDRRLIREGYARAVSLLQKMRVPPH